MKDSLALDAQLTSGCGMETKSTKSPLFFISPFISGTFDGFEEEFKHLHTKIFPKLDQLCKEKGLTFAPVDYRRTAIETRSSADFLLTHALNSIKECSPFFMAIFGQQYGTHKSPNDPPLSGKADFSRQAWKSLSSLDRNLYTAGKHGHWWVLEKKWQYCSWLELEIQAAALDETSTVEQCFFYVRDFKNSYLKQSADNAFHARNGEEKENLNKSFALISGDGFSLFEAESEHAEKRLNDLKMRIAKKGWPIKFYTNPTELGTVVLENWMRLINLLYPTLYSQNEFTNAVRWIQTSQCHHKTKYHFNDDLKNLVHSLDHHANHKTQDSSAGDHRMIGQGNEALCETPHYGFGIFSTLKTHSEPLITQQRQSNNTKKGIFAIVGDPGSGKSSLLSQWLREYESSHPEAMVISEFIGSSYVSRDIGSFMRRCIKIIREINGKSMTCSELLEDTKDYNALISAFHVSISQVPCVIVLDSLNDLKASMGEDIGSVKSLTWLPAAVSPNCKIILSTRRSDLTYKALAARNDVSISWIPILNKEDRIKLLKNRLEYQLLSIGATNAEKLTGNRLSEKPLFLVTLGGLISSCINQREVDRVIEKCTELRTFRDFWKTTFSLWTLRYSWKKTSQGQPGSCRTISVGWIVDSLRLVAASRNGLLVSEILHILFLLGYRGKSLVTPYDWMIFQKAAKDAFTVQPEGHITLSHTEIRHAVKFFLLGMPLPSATASAASLGGVNMQQHFHTLLSSYFLNYGSLERKIIELPWQLEQGGDLVMLCQVLSKPRLFESFCQAAKSHPHLNIDLLHYWKKLNEAGFNPSHYLQTMVDRSSEKTKSVFFLESRYDNQSWQPGKLGMSSLKTMSTISTSSLKRPSLVISIGQDEHRRQSTTGSQSEAGDFELMSETGSYSFFVTENEPKSEISGWNPRESNPDCTIDETSMIADESCQLGYEVCMFMEHLGGSFMQDCKDGLVALSQLMLEMRPLSSLQQLVQSKTLCSLARLAGVEQSENFIQCLCEEVLEILDSLSFSASSASQTFQESTLVTKILASRLLAEICLGNRDFKGAESLLKQASVCLKSNYSATEESNIKFSLAKLYIAKGLYSHAERNLKEVFTKRLYWYGPSHISVGHVLREMADLFSILESLKLSDQRISLLAYRQAFHIYQQNSDKNNEATLLHKIGCVLKKEGSLYSTQEARQCLENAMDLYTTQIGPTHADLPVIREDVRKLSVDLLKGRYEFGHAKPVDKRTDDYSCSAMTWHEHDLKRIAKRHDIHSAPPSFGKFCPPSSKRAWKMRTSNSAHDDVRSTATLDVRDDGQSSVKLDTVAHKANQHAVLTEYQPDEARDIVIIPAGRESRLRVAEGSEKSVSVRMPVFKGKRGQPPLEERSEPYSEYSDTIYSKRSVPRVCHHAHRKHCRPASGPNGLCLTVHGTHSAVQSIANLPPSSRSALCHKSAWYNVPGRYQLPGKILPPKHGQVRSEGALPPSRRSCRSFYSV